MNTLILISYPYALSRILFVSRVFIFIFIFISYPVSSRFFIRVFLVSLSAFSRFLSVFPRFFILNSTLWEKSARRGEGKAQQNGPTENVNAHFYEVQISLYIPAESC